MKRTLVLVALFFCVSLFAIHLSAYAAPVAGDVNQSGGVDAIDVQLVINRALGLPVSARTDINYSESTDAVDVQLVINAALGIEIDSDGDGLCEAAESNLGTRPDLEDTDGDGVGDGQEMLDGTDPLVNDGTVDRVIVPDVTNLVRSAAETALTDAGLTVGTVTTVYDDAVPQGSVVSQDPTAGTEVNEGSIVNLVVSLGPAPTIVTVPDVTNLASGEAETALTDVGLTLGTVTTAYDDTVPEGSVISQDPADGTHVDEGTSVNLVVSRGPDSGLPPEPGDVAPTIDETVPSTLFDVTEFLYTGDEPIQTGMDPDTIDEVRVAVLRGKIMDRDGDPVSGVVVTVLNRPEFGQTLTRGDGMFDMAVNGGAYLVVNYAKDEYLTAQRQVDVPWQNYVWLPDVVLIQLDTVSTEISLGVPDMQTVQSSVMTDGDGTRQATLLVPGGTSAQLVMPDGSTQTVDNLTIRATEYTVGDNGPEAMPAELPPTSGYTYCVELSADEALAAGAADVMFDKPLFFYVENFLGFPVGCVVPTGYYDRRAGQWVASDNGRVIEILSITGDMADLDTVGDRDLDSLEIPDSERRKLATLYQPGDTLWRVPITHFTPWDHNWPFGPPGDATSPEIPWFDKDGEDKPCKKGGSIIEVQNQVLGERLPVVGTPFTLNYRSNRAPGFQNAYTLEIPVTGESIPASLKRVDVEVLAAGRRFRIAFDPPSANLVYTFVWDGMDAYDRPLQGAQPVKVRVGYVYDAVYTEAEDFNRAFGDFGGSEIEGVRARQEIIIWQEIDDTVGVLDARMHGLGGWNIDVHHAYDFHSQILHLGSGERRNADSLSPVVTVIAGNPRTGGDDGDGGPATDALLTNTMGAAFGPDGSLYITDQRSNRIRRIGTDGIIYPVAGDGTQGYGGDGGPATEAQFDGPWGIVAGPDGSLYVADSDNNRIRRVGTDGIISTVAGDGTGGAGGDGGPATEAQLFYPTGVALGPDGSLYIADNFNRRIRRVGTDGIITTAAGNGDFGSGGDGGPAANAQLLFPYDVEVGPDGTIYIADYGNNRIRRVGANGIITTVAGTGIAGAGGDGGPATAAQLNAPNSLAISPDGSLYITDSGNTRIRRIRPDGIINTAAPVISFGVTFGPDDNLYVAGSSVIRKIAPILPGFTWKDLAVASEDGSELHLFDENGRHLRSVDTLRDTTIYEFDYDGDGLLSVITDRYGNQTTIERDGYGEPIAIVSPYGQSTSMDLDADRYLASVTNPANESHTFAYTSEGLLTRFTDPKDNDYSYTYDDSGLLVKAEDPAGGFKELDRTTSDTGYTVSLTTAMDQVNTYSVEYLPTGEKRRVNSLGCCAQNEYLAGLENNISMSSADGMALDIVYGPDPRWDMQSPVISSLSLSLPSGLTADISADRVVETSDPDDPLSLETMTSSLTINGQTRTTTFNSASGQFTATSPEGRQITATSDSLGKIAQYQIPGTALATFSYDEEGRPVSFTNAMGDAERTLAFTYDEDGNVGSVSDPLQRTVSFSYDDAGRVSDILLPDARQILYTYDANGNVTSVTPPGRSPHIFSYTPVNQPASYDPPDPGLDDRQTIYTFDLDHQLTSVARPDGKTVAFGHDSVGRTATITYPRGQIVYDYDQATGQLVSVTSPGGSAVAYTYDGPLLTGETWSGGEVAGSVETGYDTGLRVVEETVNGSSAVNFEYDHDGMLTGAGVLTLDLDVENGLLESTAIGNVATSLDYNGFMELETYGASFNTTQMYAAGYVRDELGRVTQKTETVNGTTDTHTFGYDLAGRLTSADATGYSASYTYDANGNRVTSVYDGETVVGIYDDQDRMIQYGDSTYTYSANGDLSSRTENGQTTTYDYDVFGNLIAVEFADETSIEYIVDGAHRRIGKAVNGTVVQGFLYKDELNPIAELDGANNVVSRFVYASRQNVPDYMQTGDAVYRIISDHLGSVRLVVNVDTGSVIQQIDYDVFGNITADTNPGFQPFGFAGGIYDQHTGLTRFGARDYDAFTGRWTAKDPILFMGGDANLYGYVSNDPVNFIDPSGLVDIWTHVGNISGGIGDACLSFATLGLVDNPGSWLRRKLGISSSVDECSDAYKVSRAATNVALKVVSMKVSPVKADIKFVKDFGNKGLRDIVSKGKHGWKDITSTAVGFGGAAAGVTQQLSQ